MVGARLPSGDLLKAKVEIYKVLGDKFQFAKKTLKEYLFPGSGVI
jgi:hypothetical protein